MTEGLPIPKSAEIEAAFEALTAPGMPFEVITKTVDGVEYQGIARQPANMAQLFMLCLQYGEADFLVLGDQRYSFAETYSAAAMIAHALIDRYKIKKGDRVGIAAKNSIEWLIAAMAVMASGAILVPFNAWWRRPELAYGIKDTQPDVIFADASRLARFEGLPEAARITFIGLEMKEAKSPAEAVFGDLVEKGVPTAMPAVEIERRDDVLILYTSGSTGHPKGAVSTHGSLVSAIMALAAFAAAVKRAMVGPNGEMPRQPAALVAGPFFHVAALHVGFLMSLVIGRRVVMVDKWDVEEVLRLIEVEAITNCGGVAAMTLDVLEAARSTPYDLSTLMDMTTGGAPFPPGMVGEVPKIISGARVTGIYGLTETNALGAVITRDAYLERPASVGKALPPTVEIKIVDEKGKDLPNGENGEILIKTIANARGYWNQPDDSAKAFRDGWHLTGDLGYLDEEGYVFIADRKKDIIIRGGENISPAEIEGVLYHHPDIAEAAVFGLPDERLGEIVAAVIRPHHGKTINEQALGDFVGQRLAYFKVPARLFETLEPLPRTATLKVDKPRLRQIYKDK